MQREEMAVAVAGEIRQRDEEGYDVSSIREAYPDLRELSEDDLKVVWDRLEQAEMRADFPYEEPSDWKGIVAAAPGPLAGMDTDLVDGDLFDRLHGAWLGRCVGSMLGKPCEGLTREQIAVRLERADAYPLAGYVPNAEPPDMQGCIFRAVRNDNIDFPIKRLEIVESYGLGFTAADLANSLASSGIVSHRITGCGIPNREQSTAMMQADVWSFVFPGRPGKAVELAFRDASRTHTKNGIYGELFAAAMISAAFSTCDVTEVVQIGLEAIPGNSRLAEAVRKGVALHNDYQDWEDTWEEINRAYGQYDWTHVIPNVCWVVLGLLYGKGEFERSVALTVMCGMDTDSTAATVGSVLGTMHESHEIPETFSGPLNDRVETSQGVSRISELARRTLDVVRRLGTNV